MALCRRMTLRLAATVTTTIGVLMAGCTADDFETFSDAQEDIHRLRAIRTADLVIIFTGSTQGMFEPCGCGGVDDGGLSRRATAIRSLDGLTRNRILVDTGDLIRRGSKVQMEFIGQAYKLLGYDAIMLGEAELRLGIDQLDELGKKQELPLLISNVTPKRPTCIRNVIELRRGCNRIAVIGVIARRHFAVLPREIRNEFTFEEPLDAVSRMTAELGGEYDAVILLSHLTADDRQKLIGKFSGIAAWIDNGGHQWKRGAKLPPKRKVGQDDNLIRTDLAPPLFVCWHSGERIGLAAMDIDTASVTATWAEIFRITKQTAQQEKLLEIYDAYKYAARQAMIANPLSWPSSGRDVFEYVPATSCRACHSRQYDWWAKTDHAKAYRVLTAASRDDDPNCWACHTTGFREQTGFFMPDSTPLLKNVACQMCHRISLKTHPAVKPAKRGLYNMTRTWHCGRCHVPHRSPRYVHEKYLKKIACPKMTRQPTSRDAGQSEGTSP